jgi:hypothetical protein
MDIETLHDRMWPGSTPIEKARRLARFSKVQDPNPDKYSDPQDPEMGTRPAPRVRAAKPKKDKKVKTVDIAKAVIATGESGVDPALFAEAITKRAAKIRKVGESEAQAYTRAITEDEKGREMFQALKQSRGRSV